MPWQMNLEQCDILALFKITPQKVTVHANVWPGSSGERSNFLGEFVFQVTSKTKYVHVTNNGSIRARNDGE